MRNIAFVAFVVASICLACVGRRVITKHAIEQDRSSEADAVTSSPEPVQYLSALLMGSREPSGFQLPTMGHGNAAATRSTARAVQMLHGRERGKNAFKSFTSKEFQSKSFAARLESTKSFAPPQQSQPPAPSGVEQPQTSQFQSFSQKALNAYSSQDKEMQTWLGDISLSKQKGKALTARNPQVIPTSLPGVAAKPPPMPSATSQSFAAEFRVARSEKAMDSFKAEEEAHQTWLGDISLSRRDGPAQRGRNPQSTVNQPPKPSFNTEMPLPGDAPSFRMARSEKAMDSFEDEHKAHKTWMKDISLKNRGGFDSSRNPQSAPTLPPKPSFGSEISRRGEASRFRAERMEKASDSFEDEHKAHKTWMKDISLKNKGGFHVSRNPQSVTETPPKPSFRSEFSRPGEARSFRAERMEKAMDSFRAEDEAHRSWMKDISLKNRGGFHVSRNPQSVVETPPQPSFRPEISRPGEARSFRTARGDKAMDSFRAEDEAHRTWMKDISLKNRGGFHVSRNPQSVVETPPQPSFRPEISRPGEARSFRAERMEKASDSFEDEHKAHRTWMKDISLKNKGGFHVSRNPQSVTETPPKPSLGSEFSRPGEAREFRRTRGDKAMDSFRAEDEAQRTWMKDISLKNKGGFHVSRNPQSVTETPQRPSFRSEFSRPGEAREFRRARGDKAMDSFRAEDEAQRTWMKDISLKNKGGFHVSRNPQSAVETPPKPSFGSEISRPGQAQEFRRARSEKAMDSFEEEHKAHKTWMGDISLKNKGGFHVSRNPQSFTETPPKPGLRQEISRPGEAQEFRAARAEKAMDSFRAEDEAHDAWLGDISLSRKEGPAQRGRNPQSTVKQPPMPRENAEQSAGAEMNSAMAQKAMTAFEANEQEQKSWLAGVSVHSQAPDQSAAAGVGGGGTSKSFAVPAAQPERSMQQERPRTMKRYRGGPGITWGRAAAAMANVAAEAEVMSAEGQEWLGQLPVRDWVSVASAVSKAAAMAVGNAQVDEVVRKAAWESNVDVTTLGKAADTVNNLALEIGAMNTFIDACEAGDKEACDVLEQEARLMVFFEKFDLENLQAASEVLSAACAAMPGLDDDAYRCDLGDDQACDVLPGVAGQAWFSKIDASTWGRVAAAMNDASWMRDAPNWAMATAAVTELAIEASTLAGLQENCDAGEDAACDVVGRGDEARKEWLAKLDAKTWGEAAASLSEVADEARAMAEVAADCEAGIPEACELLYTTDEAVNKWLATIDVPRWEAVAAALAEAAAVAIEQEASSAGMKLKSFGGRQGRLVYR